MDWSFEILYFNTINYDSVFREKLRQAPFQKESDIKKLSYEFGCLMANELKQFVNRYAITEIDAVSTHGHTVFHQPDEGKTLQIGNGMIINKITGIRTVNNFREQDVKLGGQGAPLVPIGDKLLFKKYKYCLNLGGFVNISVKKSNKIFAYDICPLNTVLNFYSKKIGHEYDYDGNFSKTGIINNNLFNELNELSFYFEKHPKSLGIEFVLEEIFPIIDKYKLSEIDILATYIKHAAYQISKNILDNEKVLISGGGSFNKTLIKSLKNYGINISLPNKLIINYKESLIFALLGHLRLNNETNCLKSVTGATRDHSSGDIYG